MCGAPGISHACDMSLVPGLGRRIIAGTFLIGKSLVGQRRHPRQTGEILPDENLGFSHRRKENHRDSEKQEALASDSEPPDCLCFQGCGEPCPNTRT